MKVSITDFKGMAPRIATHLLPEDMAQVATNVRLTSGSLRALSTPSKSANVLVPAAKAIYSLGPTDGAYMLSWAEDTDVARSPISDSEYRIYYTNGTAPKKTTLALASTGFGPYPAADYHMGVPAPTAAMTAAAAAGTNLPAPNTWVYVYTFVTQLGTALLEESAPSPPVTITTASGANQAVLLTGIASPAVTAGYNYVYKRIYRTTGTAFQMVAQVSLATTSYTDNLAATAIPGDSLITTGWLPPPTDLQGIVAMPSGTMAGFRNNEIWFCEPGFPHAWPAKYMQALDSKIVAIKAFGNNLAVATQANPYVGSGVYPDSFTFTKIPRLEPCVSKRSMAGDEFGAIYASANGLVSIGLDGDAVITEGVATRLEFAAYNPATMMGVVFERRYYGFYVDGSNASLGLVFGKSDQSGIRTVDTGASAVTIEPVTGQLLYVSSGSNVLYTFDPIGTVPLTYTWKSKRFNIPQPINFAYAQVLSKEDSAADIAYAASVAASNAAITGLNTTTFGTGALSSALNDGTFTNNNAGLNGLALNDSNLQALTPSVLSTVTLYVYAGSELKYSKDMNLNQVYTLPGGFKSIGWEFQIIGQREVSSIEVANSVKELRSS